MYEIIEFYPQFPGKKKSRIVGTLHVYDTELQLDIRGILVTEYKNKLNFLMPHKVGFDIETGEKVSYPVINFLKEEKRKSFFEFLDKEARIFVSEKISPKNQTPKPRMPQIRNTKQYNCTKSIRHDKVAFRTNASTNSKSVRFQK